MIAPAPEMPSSQLLTRRGHRIEAVQALAPHGGGANARRQRGTGERQENSSRGGSRDGGTAAEERERRQLMSGASEIPTARTWHRWGEKDLDTMTNCSSSTFSSSLLARTAQDSAFPWVGYHLRRVPPLTTAHSYAPPVTAAAMQCSTLCYPAAVSEAAAATLAATTTALAARVALAIAAAAPHRKAGS